MSAELARTDGGDDIGTKGALEEESEWGITDRLRFIAGMLLMAIGVGIAFGSMVEFGQNPPEGLLGIAGGMGVCFGFILLANWVISPVLEGDRDD